MEQKIIDAFKLKFGQLNMSATRVAGYAKKLAAKITDETTIESELDGLNEIVDFADVAKQDDRIRTLENKKPEPAPAPAPTLGLDNSVAETLAALKAELDAMKSGKTVESRKAVLEAELKDAPEAVRVFALAGISDSMTDEQFEAHKTTATATATAVQEQLKTAGLGKDAPFASSGGAGSKKPNKEQVDSVIKGIL